MKSQDDNQSIQEFVEKKCATPESKIFSSTIYQQLYSKTKKMSWDEEEELCILIDTHFPQFKTILLSLYPFISNDELLLCYLLKARFRINHICLLLSQSSSTVCMRQSRLSERLLKDMDGNVRLKDFIYQIR